MKIIEESRAPNPRRVRVFLAEKGIAVPFEQVDIMKLEHRAANFGEHNPMHQVPVLVLDDGTSLSESVAICRYFEELHPEPPLMGRSPLEKATIEMWNRRMELGLLYPVAQCVRHIHPAMAALEQPQIKEWGEVNRPKVTRMLEFLDAELAKRTYITGAGYTIADITALAAIDFMKLARIQRPAHLANLDRWYRDVSGRPSAAA